MKQNHFDNPQYENLLDLLLAMEVTSEFNTCPIPGSAKFRMPQIYHSPYQQGSSIAAVQPAKYNCNLLVEQ